jgi:hypothetical protein
MRILSDGRFASCTTLTWESHLSASKIFRSVRKPKLRQRETDRYRSIGKWRQRWAHFFLATHIRSGSFCIVKVKPSWPKQNPRAATNMALPSARNLMERYNHLTKLPFGFLERSTMRRIVSQGYEMGWLTTRHVAPLRKRRRKAHRHGS